MQFKKIISMSFACLLAISPLITVAQVDSSLYDEDGFRIDSNMPEMKVLTDGELDAIEESAIFSGDLVEENVREGEVVSCFDYYSFGSIKVDVTTNSQSYESGDPLMFKGEIINENRFPITGLDIRARLVKDIPNADYSRGEFITLDEFDVIENISIDANKTYELAYNYLLPVNAPSGEYRVLFFAYNQDRFNQAGLTFTNDITAASLVFDVIGSVPEHPYLDQTQITVGGQSHNIMSFMTQHEQGVPVTTLMPLVNPTTNDRTMNVTYDLYKWDAANPQNKISSKTEVIDVMAESSVDLEFTVDETEYPVYYLVITATPADSIKDINVSKEKTISNIRFSVDGYNYPRINAVGIDSYPLISGQESTLFTCFHNGSSIVDTTGVTVETILTDENGRELARSEYSGDIIPDISAIATKFVPRADYSQLNIVTRLLAADGSEIDKVEVVYDCDEIDSLYCVETKNNSWMFIVIGALIIIGLLFIIGRRKRLPNTFSV